MAAPAVVTGPKPRVIFDLHVAQTLVTLTLAAVAVVIVLLAIVLSNQGAMADAMRAGAAALATAPGINAASAAGYMCTAPYTTKQIKQYTTWLLLGNDLIAGAGVLNVQQDSWYQLLATKLGVQPTIIQAGGMFGGNLTLQAQWVKAQAAYRQMVADRSGAVIFISAGQEWLLQQPQAALDALSADFAALFAGSAPLVPVQGRSNYPVYWLVPPNPLADGLSIDPAVTQCAAPYAALNGASSWVWQHQQSVASLLHTLYWQQATILNSGTYVDLDEALGAYSLAAVNSLQHSVFAPNCRSYNNLGQSMLADLLQACMAGTPYVVG
jgi:hypothetical protein